MFLNFFFRQGCSTLFCLLAILAFFCISEGTQAKQRKARKGYRSLIRADRCFNENNMKKAEIHYERTYKKDSTNYYALFQLAESCRYLKDYSKALYHYQKITSSPEVLEKFPISPFYQASVQKQLGFYKEAVKSFVLQLDVFENCDDPECELYCKKTLQEIEECIENSKSSLK